MLNDRQAHADEQPWPERFGTALGNLLVLPTLLILFGAALYAIGDALFADIEKPTDPDVLDNLLASEAVIASVRIAMIFAAGYLVVSVVALISRRQWLTRVGPVQVSEEVTGLFSENQRLRDAIESAGGTIQDLEDELRDTTQVLDALADRMPNADEEDE